MTTATCLAQEGDDIQTEFWTVIAETKDHLSQLDLELPSEVKYFEDVAEHVRKKGRNSGKQYSAHKTRADELISCLDSYHAEPGTEKLWEVLKRVYGNATLSETERLRMYRAADEVFECARSLLPALIRLKNGLAQSNL